MGLFPGSVVLPSVVAGAAAATIPAPCPDDRYAMPHTVCSALLVRRRVFLPVRHVRAVTQRVVEAASRCRGHRAVTGSWHACLEQPTWPDRSAIHNLDPRCFATSRRRRWRDKASVAPVAKALLL